MHAKNLLKYRERMMYDIYSVHKVLGIDASLQILKDEKKRAAYDQYGAASQTPGFDPNAFASGFGSFTGGFPGFGGFTGRSGGGDGSGDFFEQLFNSFSAASGSRSRNAQGDDIQAAVTISFLEACKGTKKKVTVTPVDDCSTCSSTGLKSGVQRSTCSSCKGTGSRTFVLENGFQMATTCRQCGGEGSTIPKGGECNACGGAGKIRSKRTVNVTIPIGESSATLSFIV
jgi:molecular chaperone DnaJ